ncbi:MAG: tRNA(Ile)-lysidine synthase [Bacteroidota bacterium]
MLCFNANKVLQRINTFIQEHKLFDNSDKIGLAISGGKDSTALAYVLNQLNYPFVMIHCNFKLRGMESEQDEVFVRNLGKELQNCIGVFCTSFNTEMYAKNKGINIQLAARELRYNYFDELYKEGAFTVLLTAHHQDDASETFLINLIRGSGINGLKGIPIKRGYIRRPMLEVPSKEIVSYLANLKANYREDSSNKSTKYHRNKIRNVVLPELEKVVPNINKSIAKSVEILRSENELLNHFLNQIADKIMSVDESYRFINISKSGLFSYPQPSVVLYHLLDSYGFNFDQCIQVCNANGESGRLFYSDNYVLLVDREYFILKEESTFRSEGEIEILGEGTFTMNNATLVLEKTSKIQFTNNTCSEIAAIPKDMFPLSLRYWRQGDYIVPLGMNGKKLLSDFFIDQKMSVFEKESTPLLCSKNNVLWICGKRLSNDVKATSDADLYALNIIFGA